MNLLQILLLIIYLVSALILLYAMVFYNPLICNQCRQKTRKEFLIRDIGYDDWGYQCLVCAKRTGLLARKNDYEIVQSKILEERKNYEM